MSRCPLRVCLFNDIISAGQSCHRSAFQTDLAQFLPDGISAALGGQADPESIVAGIPFTSIYSSSVVLNWRVYSKFPSVKHPRKQTLVLLLLCVELVQRIPGREDTQSLGSCSLVEEYSSEIESEGAITLRTVQARTILCSMRSDTVSSPQHSWLSAVVPGKPLL
jgi:hypothetical protein